MQTSLSDHARCGKNVLVCSSQKLSVYACKAQRTRPALAKSPVICAAGLVVPQLPRSDLTWATAIVGAIIMPHNIYLHSALVQSR